MNLLVIGSTGRTGKHVLEQGLQRGHAITAFTRRPHELAGLQGLKESRLDPDARRLRHDPAGCG